MMQTTTKTRFWKYFLPAVAVVLVVGFAALPRSAPSPSYRRFTSPAFPDGVRYTLLCPSDLDDFSLHSFSANSQFLQVSKRESHLPGMSLWHRWFRPGFRPESEFILVSVEKPAARPLNAKPPRSSRVDRQGVRNSMEIAHRVYVDDPRAREHFVFHHIDDFGIASYARDDRVVAGSFRILMPGEPVPTP